MIILCNVFTGNVSEQLLSCGDSFSESLFGMGDYKFSWGDMMSEDLGSVLVLSLTNFTMLFFRVFTCFICKTDILHREIMVYRAEVCFVSFFIMLWSLPLCAYLGLVTSPF